MKKSKLKQANLFLICVHCIVFSLNMSLGINIGFIIDTWLQPVLILVPWGIGPWVGASIALLSGALIGVGAYGLFIESERAWTVIWTARRSIPEAVVRTIALILVNLMWIGIGILGLVYRLQFLNQHGVILLFWIGVLLECSQPLFGLVLYPMKHRPAEMIEDEGLETFRASHVEDLYGKLESLPIDRRHEAYEALRNGNEETVRELLHEEVELEERRRREDEQMKVDARRTKELEKQRKEKPTRVFTGGRKSSASSDPRDFPNAQVNNQADPLSNGNGHRR